MFNAYQARLCERASLDGVNDSNPSLMMLFSGSWSEKVFLVKSGWSHPSKTESHLFGRVIEVIIVTVGGLKVVGLDVQVQIWVFFLEHIPHYLLLSQSGISWWGCVQTETDVWVGLLSLKHSNEGVTSLMLSAVNACLSTKVTLSQIAASCKMLRASGWANAALFLLG